MSLNYSNKNLQGRSFRDKNLTNADFSNSDIRGANFSGAILNHAKFCGAKAGIQQKNRVILIILSSIFSICSGIAGSFAGYFTVSLYLNDISYKGLLNPGLIISAVYSFLGITVVLWGYEAAILAGGVSIAATGLVVLFGNIAGNMAAAIASAGTIAVLAPISLTLARIVAGHWIESLVIFEGIFSALVAEKFYSHIPSNLESMFIWNSVSLTLFFLGIYVSHNSYSDTGKYQTVFRVANLIACLFGTKFISSNLKEADFSEANIKFCDFRESIVDNAYWFHARCINYIRAGSTYLKDRNIRDLVVTLNGVGKTFDRCNLSVINLKSACLEDCSLISADLSGTNLQYSNLSRAKLARAQLDNTDMTGAILTGACIEDWGITSTTKLDDLQCDFVYMRLYTVENGNTLRKPDDNNKYFNKGEFADFIKPYFDTLDLYHRQNVDPRAISIALKDLADNHPDAQLQFVAIEWRGHGLNIRYTTAPSTDKSKLSREYFENYAKIKKQLLQDIQSKLVAQDAVISKMESMIDKFIQTGTYQTTVHANTIQSIQGGMTMTENKGININVSGGSIGDIGGLVGGDVNGVVNLGEISGNVTNAINQLSDESESNQLSLKSLLTQLQQFIQNDSDLPELDKSDLLEQVQLLAEAKQVKEPIKKEGLARKAMKMFDATLKGLPDTAKLVDACSKLLPLILKSLGLPNV